MDEYKRSPENSTWLHVSEPSRPSGSQAPAQGTHALALCAPLLTAGTQILSQRPAPKPPEPWYPLRQAAWCHPKQTALLGSSHQAQLPCCPQDRAEAGALPNCCLAPSPFLSCFLCAQDPPESTSAVTHTQESLAQALLPRNQT